MGNEQADRRQSATPATDERRLENRILIEWMIEVSGFDCFSRHFTERTQTCDVSESGCQFRLHTVLAPETVVAVRAVCECGMKSSLKVDLFRIVRTCQESQAVLIGAQALQAFQSLGLPWGTLYRSLLFGLLFSAIRRVQI